MSPQPPWTDDENDLLVADHFAMLADELAGRKFSKAGHRRELQERLRRRTEPSIEFKHRNVSAVLQGLGEDWIRGYRPAANFQATLIDAVERWLARNPGWLGRPPRPLPVGGTAPLLFGHAPTLGNRPPPKGLDRTLEVALRFDVPARDERNRELGRAGEERVLLHERAELDRAGRRDLAERVRWVSVEDGDGAGFDIESFTEDGRARLIEVKTTNGWERTPFHITSNELAVADRRPGEWLLTRVWNFSREPRAFDLRPPLETHVSLTPTTFRAEFG